MVPFTLMFVLIICSSSSLSQAAGDELVINGNATKRTVYESLTEEFPRPKKEEIKKAFKEIIGSVLDAPKESYSFDSTDDSLVAILDVFQKSGGDIFDQIANELKVLPNPFYKTIVSQNKDLIHDIIRHKKITKEQWINLRDTRYRFLPSQKHYSATEYTKDFYPDIMAFAIVFIAGTIDLTLKGEAYKCQLSKELDLFKNDVETSIQALIYKRLNMLEPHASSWRWIDISMGNGRDKINFLDKFTGELLCSDGCVLNDGQGRNPVVDSIQHIASSVQEDASEMFDFLDKLFIQLTKSKAFCFDGCVCPDAESAVKVERNDYVKDFPWSCLGKPNKSGKSCKLPCGKYGESYDWCPTELENRASSWNKCGKANQDMCVQGWFKKK